MKVSGATTRPRNTQDQRSALMRTKLLDATIECLAEKGYCRTTTTDIAVRAGVSRGAQLHHFPAKIELVTAAVRHLAEKRLAYLRSKAPHLEGKPDRISAGIDLLWSVFYGPWFNVAIELWIAARTDPELCAAVYPTEQHMATAFESLWRDLFGEIASTPQFRDVLRLTLYIMRGMTLEGMLKKDDRRRRALLEVWKSLLSHAIDHTGEHSVSIERGGTTFPSPSASAHTDIGIEGNEPE